MSMDGFNLGEDGEASSGSVEITAEQLEQYRERAKKTAAQAKRDKKNEQKQKKQENVLSHIIIQNFLNQVSTNFHLTITLNFLFALRLFYLKTDVILDNQKNYCLPVYWFLVLRMK